MKNVKKIFLPFIIAISTCGFAAAQCTIDSTITSPGLYPSDTAFPCIERNVPFNEDIQFKNYSTVDGHDFFSAIPAGTSATVDSIQILQFYNLPTGITATCSDSICRYSSGENGCIALTGTTNDAGGEYPVKFKAHIWVHANIPFLGLQYYDTEVDSAQLNRVGLAYNLLINNLDAGLNVTTNGATATATSTSTGANRVTYYIAGVDTNTTGEFTFTTNGTYTVFIEAANRCGTEVDSQDVTITSAAVPEINNIGAAMALYPNPTNGKVQLTISSAVASEIYNVRIFNVQGREVFKAEYSGNVNAAIDMQTSGAGVYFLHISSKNVSKVEKLIIK
jgi:hypothetical protein